MTTIDDCRLIDLPRINTREGSITPVHGSREIPFDVVRVFYVYDVPGGEGRGAHAHRELHQFIVSVMGAFDVTVDDGLARRTITLSRAYHGLYVPNTIWCALSGFSSGAVCVVLTSDHFKEDDYIRNYDDYRQFRNAGPVS
jgi:hypothetical protein